ncbi:MAG: DNA-processing protein DprA [Bacteroidetes bacterium]|nr:DNA-processing protein DprA [Bacteroidota bacterium]
MNDPYDYFCVSRLPGIGSLRGRSLLQCFGSFSALLRAEEGDLLRVDGISRVMAQKLRDAFREERKLGTIARLAEQNRETADRRGFRFVAVSDPVYPATLRSIYDPPLFLYCWGRLEAEDENGIAVVGSRRPSDYGRQVTEEFCRVFAASGVSVISGLAFGIDTVAHRTTLRCGGRTVAVLGSGLARIYPSVNRSIAEEAAERGCVLSELPLNAKPDAVNFPRRNRIISGLSRGLIVMESAVTGGAMISAGIALDQNREVFAVPGNIHNAMSAGPHALLRRSMAQIATSPEVVLEELSLQHREAKPEHLEQLSIVEQQIFEELSAEPLHIDELAARTGFPLSSLLTDLLQMEFKGAIRQLPGKYFQRRTRQQK